MAPTTVRMSIEWLVPVAQARSITLALQSVGTTVRPMHGCLGCRVSMGVDTTGTVRYVEEWASEDDLRRRLRTDGFAELTALEAAVGRPPRIDFALPQGTRPSEFLRKISGAPTRTDAPPVRRLLRTASRYRGAT